MIACEQARIPRAGRSLSYIFPGLSLRFQVAGYMLLVGRELSNWKVFVGLLFSIKVARGHAHSSQGKSPALFPNDSHVFPFHIQTDSLSK